MLLQKYEFISTQSCKQKQQLSILSLANVEASHVRDLLYIMYHRLITCVYKCMFLFHWSPFADKLPTVQSLLAETS